MPPSAGIPRFDHRADVTGIGLVALALVLGRPLRADEFPQRIPALLNEGRERTALGNEQPLSPPLRSWLARALQLDLRRAFASAPEALTALGDLYFEEGQHKEALRVYKTITDLQPKEADGYVNIGLVYNSMERTEEAIKAYNTALELDPKNVFAYNALGDAWYGLGEQDKAIAAFRKGIEIEPDDAET